MLTPAQLATLKAAILAETDAAFVIARNKRDDSAMEAFYAADTSPAWNAWRPSTAAADVFDAVVWANLTPADAPDGTALFTNRALLCQAKQINLQILLQGQQQIATGKLNVRQGLSDALQNVPAGAAGANVDAGWTGTGHVKLAIQRVVNKGERLFAAGTGTPAVPGDLTFDGRVTAQNISDALALP
jgi:hypothetical protein